MLSELGAFGSVFDVMPEINAVIMLGKASQLDAIRALPYVASAEPDGEVTLDDPQAAALASFVGGFSMWNLDAVNVTTGPGAAKRNVTETGKGVYIGVLDSGLLPTWRAYFIADRIATEYATSFVGGGAPLIGEDLGARGARVYHPPAKAGGAGAQEGRGLHLVGGFLPATGQV